MKALIILIIIFYNVNLFSQYTNFGVTSGLSFSFGNKVNRIGLRASGFYVYGIGQVNASLNAYYNFQSLAIKKKTPELQLGIGTQIGFGKKDTSSNHFIGLIDNNTDRYFSGGYTYQYFFDKQNTSQGGGIINLNIEHFTFATSNDLFGFGKGWRDRFRTAAVLLQYRYLDTKIALNSTFWTGDYIGCKKIKNSNYPARFGYKENDKAIYGKYTAALTSIQIEQVLPYSQIARLNIGMDNEKVRHLLQNRLIHDQDYIPKKWIKIPQMHFPMLDENGNQYLFREGQHIKPTTIYYNIGLNNSVFY